MITLVTVGSSDPARDVDARIADGEEAHSSRARLALQEFRQVGEPDLATVSGAARQIRSTVR